MVTLFVVLAVAVAALGALGAVVWRRVRRVRRYAVHMKDGMPTITGLIVRRGPRRFILISAELEQGEDRTHSMAGHIEVLRENVFCLQEIE